MYKLPQEIKKILIISSIVSLVISLVLVFIKPIYVIFYLIGFGASVGNMFIKNFVATTICYKITKNAKATAVWLNILGNLIYLIVLFLGFYNGLVEGFIVAAGMIVSKIVMVILYGFK